MSIAIIVEGKNDKRRLRRLLTDSIMIVCTYGTLSVDRLEKLKKQIGDRDVYLIESFPKTYAFVFDAIVGITVVDQTSHAGSVDFSDRLYSNVHLRIEDEFCDLAMRIIALIEYHVERIFDRFAVFLCDAFFELHELFTAETPRRGERKSPSI